MTRKEVMQRLEQIGCNLMTYDNIKYYLSVNNWTLKNITDIQPDEVKGYCKLYLDNELIGVFYQNDEAITSKTPLNR